MNPFVVFRSLVLVTAIVVPVHVGVYAGDDVDF